ncbi:uncharacterized protein C8R40DRAFT_1072782 [Lentinula edodes]|uniref:uncharacterized protein n=1 Tax=Lentinula edodes TaxID=5353 RepID=UPI001E8D2DA6|nr:uncharacterized protein C8R40DRAFT_1072782 [Lentinula edodes]KAH7870988.1 hypothetical protein C8R40DRAFT_1072782 [Lentinula edodes]
MGERYKCWKRLFALFESVPKRSFALIESGIGSGNGEGRWGRGTSAGNGCLLFLRAGSARRARSSGEGRWGKAQVPNGPLLYLRADPAPCTTPPNTAGGPEQGPVIRMVPVPIRSLASHASLSSEATNNASRSSGASKNFADEALHGNGAGGNRKQIALGGTRVARWRWQLNLSWWSCCGNGGTGVGWDKVMEKSLRTKSVLVASLGVSRQLWCCLWASFGWLRIALRKKRILVKKSQKKTED